MKQFNPLPWQIDPLNGKYYGTTISDSNGEIVCKIWNHKYDDPDGNYPSDRQIKEWEPFESPKDREEVIREMRCDTHYESTGDYAAALLILSAVNRGITNR